MATVFTLHPDVSVAEITELRSFLTFVLIQRNTQPGSAFLAPLSFGKSPMNMGSVK